MCGVKLGDRHAQVMFVTDDFQGVRKYHRTIATTLNTLIAEGFAIRKVVEYAPTKEDISADPSLQLEAERPMFLIVSAQR